MGGRPTGDGYAAQGNILVSAATVDALADTFEAGDGKQLAERLLDCLDAARQRAVTARASSRPRCSSSSVTRAMRRLSDSLVDLRVEDHERPLEELRRLYDVHGEVFGRRRRAGSSTTSSRQKSAACWDGSGTATLHDWAGTENLEERVNGVDGLTRIVLRELRGRREHVSEYEVRESTISSGSRSRSGLEWRPIRGRSASAPSA